MCNPRRVTITATRELDEAWQRVVSRRERVDVVVSGEARVRQVLGATLSMPVRIAFEAALAGGLPGWREESDGVYRHDVEGGYVRYHADGEGVMEIVGRAEGVVSAEGRAEATISGHTEGTTEGEVEEGYYDDAFAGNDEKAARNRGQAKLDRQLEQQARDRVAADQKAAEEQAAAGLTEQARQAAREEARRLAAAKEAELRREAAARLTLVGARARRVVSEALARSYREAILAYATRNNAEMITDRNDDGVVEIEFRLRG